MGNLYTMTDSTNFQTIQEVIINFIDNYKKIIWNIFVNKGTKYTTYSNITISNTQLSTLIRYILNINGLSDYIEKSKRFKPY